MSDRDFWDIVNLIIGGDLLCIAVALYVGARIGAWIGAWKERRYHTAVCREVALSDAAALAARRREQP